MIFHCVCVLRTKSTCSALRTKPHHAIPSQEVGEDFFVYVVHQSSWTLVVVSGINEELLAGVLVNQRAHLETIRPSENMEKTAGSHVLNCKC